MNLVLIGGIASGKNEIIDALSCRENNDLWRCYDIDNLRARFSDGTYAGDAYCWSLLLRAAQHEQRGVFSLYGDEPYVQTFNQTVSASLSKGTCRWLGVLLRSDIEAIGSRVSEKTAAPFPHSQQMSNTQKLYHASLLGLYQSDYVNNGQTPYPFFEFDTSKYDINSPLLVQDLIQQIEHFSQSLESSKLYSQQSYE